MPLDIIVLNKYSLYEEIYYDVSKLSFNPRSKKITTHAKQAQPLVLLLEVQRAGAVLRLVLRLGQQLVQLAQLLAVLQVVC